MTKKLFKYILNHKFTDIITLFLNYFVYHLYIFLYNIYKLTIYYFHLK